MRLTLAGGLALLLAAIAVTLSGSPSRVISTNSVALRGQVAVLYGPATVCQPEAALPHDISAVRMTLESVVGPHVLVVASSGGRVLASGTRGSGWTGADVTVPVSYKAAATSNTTLCVTLGQGREQILMLGDTSGVASAATSNGARLIGRLRVEYLAAGQHSWWSQALPVAQSLGLGRAPGGTWVAGLILALMVAVAVLASRLVLRELGGGRVASSQQADATVEESTGRLASCLRALGHVPTAAWACALIACLNAASWSILSPPFQAPDEPAHFAYVQQLVEAHELPYTPQEGADEEYSPEEQTALEDLRQRKVAFMPSAHTIATRAQEQKLEHDLAQPLSRRGSGFASTATSEPPLYYAFEAIPYVLGSSGTLLDRLELMRLFSCLFAGLTALFAFMFVRETLPRVPWAWTVAGLGVALAPLLAFISGGVNPEGMLCAVSAALFYLLARAFARELTPRLAATICAVLVVGLLSKLNAVGLVPGVMLGLLVGARRASRGSRRVVYRSAATLILAAGALLLVLAVGPFSSEVSLGFISDSVTRATQTYPVLGELSYTWQLFLPRLPGMTNYFPGLFTPRQLWFDGLVGLYGWGDTVFPALVYDAALVPAGLIGLLSLRALVFDRGALGRRASELAVYVTMGAGVLALVGLISYSNDVAGTGGPFWEPRYLLPMLPLLGAVLALAARGAGRRLGPLVGVAIVVLVLGHDVFSQLLVAARYYG